MRTQTAVAARRWLAEADPDPAHAHRWWEAQSVALLPVGKTWDVIKVPAAHGRRAIETAGLVIPVIDEGRTGGHLFFLVPVGTAAVWDLQGTVGLGDTAYLSVPVPTRNAPPGPYWLIPPDGSGLLADPVALHAALEAAR